MPALTDRNYVFRCQCGQVEIIATGDPITTIVCYCDDCQAGARYIESLPNAPRVLDEQGGTDIALYRTDRVQITRGKTLLKPHKNREGTVTNRHYSTCCNTQMLADFDNWQPWISLYRHTAADGFPDLEMRIFTKFSPLPDDIPEDVPTYKTYPLTFPFRMLKVALAMRLGF